MTDKAWGGCAGTAFTVTAAALVKRLVASLPPPNRHLTSFHGVYGPNSRLRPIVMMRPTPPTAPTPAVSAPRHLCRRIDWATLHRRTFGTDVLQCPCGGRRTVTALHSTRKAAEKRLVELGLPCRSRLLPPQTAPPQRELAV
ncbi:MAG: hypothetical protein Q8K32_31950 [Archangium sp.]|nr:hypothetical protein [Archangium sp.]MDP3569644.1 hypothetical protein [Archangium sp.]